MSLYTRLAVAFGRWHRHGARFNHGWKSGFWLPWAVRRAAGRRAPKEPAIVVSHPVPHEGATEDFGRILHNLRDVEVSPELVSDIETELRWGMAWHDFETALRVELDRICDPVVATLSAPRTFAELRDLLDLPAELVTT